MGNFGSCSGHFDNFLGHFGKSRAFWQFEVPSVFVIVHSSTFCLSFEFLELLTRLKRHCNGSKWNLAQQSVVKIETNLVFQILCTEFIVFDSVLGMNIMMHMTCINLIDRILSLFWHFSFKYQYQHSLDWSDRLGSYNGLMCKVHALLMRTKFAKDKTLAIICQALSHFNVLTTNLWNLIQNRV